MNILLKLPWKFNLFLETTAKDRRIVNKQGRAIFVVVMQYLRFRLGGFFYVLIALKYLNELS